jgi:hypothetical protein
MQPVSSAIAMAVHMARNISVPAFRSGVGVDVIIDGWGDSVAIALNCCIDDPVLLDAWFRSGRWYRFRIVVIIVIIVIIAKNVANCT